MLPSAAHISPACLRRHEMGGPSDLELPCSTYLLTETETDGLLLCGGFQYDSVTVSEKDRALLCISVKNSP